MFWKSCSRLLVLLLGLWLIFDLVSRLGAEIFWFQEIGYLRVFLLRLTTQGVLWAIAIGITTVYLLGNLVLARRWKYPKPRALTIDSPVPVPPRRGGIRLRWLIPLVLGLNLLLALMLYHYGQVAFRYWHPAFNSPHVPPLIPALFRPGLVWQLVIQLISQNWAVGLVGGLAIALLIYPQSLVTAGAVGMSVILGLVLSANWIKVLQYFRPTAFNTADPVFDRDISFYVFALPFWELLEFWLVGLFLYGLIAVALIYLLSGDSLSQGWFRGFSPQQQQHLQGLGTCLMLAVAFSYWLSRYELLYSPLGAVYGAGYTDVTVQLPAYTVLCLLAVAIAGWLLWSMLFWVPKGSSRRFLWFGLGLYLLLAVGAGSLLPVAVQTLVVQPNELGLEQPYIQRNIALTRLAFDLEDIDAITFDPQNQLTYEDILENDLIIRNIRLWDQRPLLETNRQLQQIRLYYRFPDADIDRYTLQPEVPGQRPSTPEELPEGTAIPDNELEAERRQTLIAARELDYAAVPQQAQTWVNQHLIYTHGYGFTLSPVNTVAPGGLPEYFVKDIGETTANDTGSPLTTATEAIRASIPIGQPRIYYGEITNPYVMTGTRVQELDYPSGNENVYNVYDGRGGIGIAPLWRRLLFAAYLKDWQMVLTQDFLPQTKLLFRRNINQRIRAIAPFLQYDRDPYLVAADANPDDPNEPSKLFWIVDAYTTSERYPYSDPASQGINYIRNSVKVVIDAYHGSVEFYIADPSDPIIATLSAIFPGLFKPLSAMPVTLRSHIRYPLDFFGLQSERLRIYHMTDTQVFYNREDEWKIPTEVYADKPRLVEPYYLITSLPAVPFEEFILLLPYTPRQRNNLIAWLAARSDGENYGRLLLYQFPKQLLVYGPEQIEARINQDPVISQQISLWNRQGSRAVQGNLLVIPIERSLLYVEPIYLEATQESLPTLVRVVVAYENRIVMAESLEQALEAIFQQPEETTTPPIIRPVEEPVQ